MGWFSKDPEPVAKAKHRFSKKSDPVAARERTKKHKVERHLRSASLSIMAAIKAAEAFGAVEVAKNARAAKDYLDVAEKIARGFGKEKT